MNRSPVVLLLLALGSPALAQESEGTYQTRLLPPGTWDLHFGGLGDGLLRDVSLSLAADYGLTVAGSGTLGLGLELNGGTCLLGCETFAGAGATWQDAVGLFRVVYHIPFSGETSGVAASNVYGVALAGAAVVTQRTQWASAVSVGPAVGVGIGSLYFPGNGDTLFAGGEMRILYAAGIGASPAWNLFGLGFRVSLGVRL
jgi:hypothetical protein